MRNIFAVTCISFFLVSSGSAFDLPDATARVLVFADQLADAPGTANFEFNATHYIGSQKLDKERIDAYKAINPKFIVVQYHKSYGTDLQQNITSATSPVWNNDCDTFYAWVDRHPEYGTLESYYMHYSDVSDSAHRIEHYWNGVNEYYLADIRHDGWRQYVSEVNVWRCQNIGFDGTFFDATYFPSWGYNPERWFDSIPFNAGGITNFGTPWNQSFATPYWTFIHDYFHSDGRDYLCIVNSDQMVTGWYNDDYLEPVDGAMTEGFFTYSGKLTGGDWTISARNILKYLTGRDKNKVLLAQCAPGADNQSLRRWCIANYFLLKNQYSYYFILSGSAAWWPEYEIDLDSFVTQPASLADLQVEGTSSLYKREYKNGLVLVNPGSEAQSMSLPQQFYPVSFSGGGSVSNGEPPPMTISYGDAVSGTVTVDAGEVLILRTDNGLTKVRPSRHSSADFGANQLMTVYTITGRRVGQCGGGSRRFPVYSEYPIARGIYLARKSSSDRGSPLVNYRY